jgi:hypothetical protein
VVVNAPVGIRVIRLLYVPRAAGTVIVAIGVVPETNTMGVVGAIVVALAIVGAAVVTASDSVVPSTRTLKFSGA